MNKLECLQNINDSFDEYTAECYGIKDVYNEWDGNIDDKCCIYEALIDEFNESVSIDDSIRDEKDVFNMINDFIDDMYRQVTNGIRINIQYEWDSKCGLDYSQIEESSRMEADLEFQDYHHMVTVESRTW